MVKKCKILCDKIPYIIFIGFIILNLIAICWVNFNSGLWYNYDIYSDSMIAKHIVEAKSLFPPDWTYGNQLYVIATPVISALIYAIYPNTVVALGIASCIMTLLTIISFLWYIRPFVDKKSQIVGLFVLIGISIFGVESGNSTTDNTGLQLFFTMASYYACYLIGIIFTVGIWLRLHFGHKVTWWLVALCFGVNFALGMQSLRETLVLNLPLCLLVVILSFFNKEKGKKKWLSKSNIFVFATLISNLIGLLFVYVLIRIIPINQIDILENTEQNIFLNLSNNIHVFCYYIGLQIPPMEIFSLFKFATALILVAIVLVALIIIIKNQRITPLSCTILFCLFSLCAVFGAGLFIIKNRHIYFFVWILLVTFSCIYLVEKFCDKKLIKNLIFIALMFIGLGTFYFRFYYNILNYNDNKSFYQDVTDSLVDEGVTHVYCDASMGFRDHWVSALSNDKITGGSFFMNTKIQDCDNLVTYVNYIYSSKWFDKDQISKPYIMLTGKRLKSLEEEGLDKYKSELLSHLTLEHYYTHNDKEYYFYSFSEDLYCDLISF